MASDIRIKKIKAVISKRQEGMVVLEDIHDPHNAAAIWRTCDAFGFQKVSLIFEKEKSFNPKITGKTSSGSANKWLSFETYKSTKECIKELKEKNFTIYATVLDKTAKKINQIKFKNNKTAIMFGNEHSGLSKTAIEMADEKIYIPMKGMVQSLNLSVTAAIILYEIDRQRKGLGKITNEESKSLRKKYLLE